MRRALAVLLLLGGALLVPVATLGRWAHDTVVPVEGYLEAVEPLSREPAVLAEVEDRVVAATLQRLEAEAGPFGGQAEPLVRAAVERAVAAPAFAAAWEASNRTLHRQLVRILSGDDPAPTSGTVDVQLAPVSAAVRDELTAAGVPFADRLPTVRAGLPLLPADDLTPARGAYRLIDTWGPVLPFLVLAVITLGLLVARRRAVALAITAVGSIIGLGLLAVAVLVGRLAVPSLAPSSVPDPVATTVYDALTAGLWRYVLVVSAGAALLLVLSLLASRRKPDR